MLCHISLIGGREQTALRHFEMAYNGNLINNLTTCDTSAPF